MQLSPGPLALLALPLVAFLAAAQPSGQTHPTPDDTVACAAQAGAFLQARLPTWQKRLGLEDWKISVVVSPERDLKPNTLGNVHWDTEAKSAVIRALNPAGYRTSCAAATSDMENTLVHELVHIELSSLPRSTDSRKVEEAAVNRITAALLQLGSAGAAPMAVTAAASPSTPSVSSADRKAGNN